MKYHYKEKIYCLSEEDRNSLMFSGDRELFFDSELNNYYWLLESVKETDPNFFEVEEEDWLKVVDLGYSGKNDIREIIDWMEFEYNISYTRQHYQGPMVSGNRSSFLESYIILRHRQLSSFISISVINRDERSKYILLKKVLSTMLDFFEVRDGEICGPSTEIFNKMIRGETVWT